MQAYWTILQFFRFVFVSQHSGLVTIKLSLMALRIVYLAVFYVMSCHLVGRQYLKYRSHLAFLDSTIVWFDAQKSKISVTGAVGATK